MPFLIKIISSDLTQILILSLQWPGADRDNPSRGIDYIEPNGWSGAYRSWAARATIMTVFFIALMISIVFSRLVQSLGVFGVLRRLRSRLLRPKRVLVKNLLLDAFVRLEGGSIAPKTAIIHLLNPRRQVENGFGLHNNGFLNSLL